MGVTARVFTVLPVIAALAAPVRTQSPAEIPLREGLMVVTAIHEPGRGDYESIKQLDAVSAETLHFVYSADRGGRPIKGARTVLKKDLASARKYRNYFNGNEDRAYDGWTALGPSKAVLADLASTGETAFTFQIIGGSDRHAIQGTIKRTGTEPYPVLLNGSRVELPAIKAEGVFDHYKVEFWFLDAPEQPLTLAYYAYRHWPDGLQEKLEALARKTGRPMPKLSEHRLDVVKIEFPSAETSESAEGPIENIEKKLEESGRAEVYGIYFDFGSDRIRPESAGVIAEIAALLKKNQGWALSIEGHTDNIGADAYNLDLSTRRAAAVKSVLVEQHAIEAGRLTTAGHGASQPKESNDTLAGRARNRRVELVRR
jgi:OOP family OmpA-OmpF porin